MFCLRRLCHRPPLLLKSVYGFDGLMAIAGVEGLHIWEERLGDMLIDWENSKLNKRLVHREMRIYDGDDGAEESKLNYLRTNLTLSFLWASGRKSHYLIFDVIVWPCVRHSKP